MDLDERVRMMREVTDIRFRSVRNPEGRAQAEITPAGLERLDDTVQSLARIMNRDKPSQTVPEHELADSLDEFFSYRGRNQFESPNVRDCPTWLRDSKLMSDRDAAKAFHFSKSQGIYELNAGKADTEREAAEQAHQQVEEDSRTARDVYRGSRSSDEVELNFNNQFLSMILPIDLPDVLDTAATIGLGEDFEVPLIRNSETPLPPGFVPLKLHPWQVEAVGWLLQKQFETSLKGAILAHDVGLGKTISALMFLKQSTERSLRNLKSGEYRPNVLIVPANLIAQWTDEACQKTEAHTGLRLRVFEKGRCDASRGTLIETHRLTKEEFYGDLVLQQRGVFDPWNAATQQTVILTSYSTWHARTVCTLRQARELANEGFIKEHQFAEGLPNPDKDAETSDSEVTTPAEEIYVKSAVRRFTRACKESGLFSRGKDSGALRRKIAKAIGRELKASFLQRETETKREYIEHKHESANWRSLVEGRISLAVIDEASTAANLWTRTWISIKNMRADFVAMLSATPCPKNLIDWIAILAIIHPTPDTAEEFDWYEAVNHEDVITTHPGLEKKHGREAVVRIYQLPEFVAHRTNPDIFCLLCDEGRLDPFWSSKVFPQLFPFFVLPRTHGQMMVVHRDRPSIEVGAGIPPHVLRQCHLLPSFGEASQYFDVYGIIKNALGQGDVEILDRGTECKFNLGAYRQLQIATASPCLPLASQIINENLPLDDNKLKFDSALYVNLLAQTPDKAIDFLLDRMTPDPLNPLAFGWTGHQRANYLAFKSVKLRCLAGILKFHVHLRGEKMIIIAEWPLVMLMILAFTASLGFKTLILTSDMKWHEKQAVQEKWNSASDEHQILLSTGQVISHGYNLHNCCNTMVVFDCPSPPRLLFQRLAIVHRLGQTKTQYIYQLFCMGTVDDDKYFEYPEKLRALLSN